MVILLALSLLVSGLTQAEPDQLIRTEIKLLKRSELPDEFQFPLLELGYAVMQVRIENGGQQPIEITRSDLEVIDPKGKPIPVAATSEITPRIMKSKVFRRTNRDIHGQPNQLPPVIFMPTPPDRPSSVPPRGAKVRSAGKAQEIRQVLEQYQIQDVTLQPGETLEGFLYLATKKRPQKLAHTRLRHRGRILAVLSP